MNCYQNEICNQALNPPLIVPAFLRVGRRRGLLVPPYVACDTLDGKPFRDDSYGVALHEALYLVAGKGRETLAMFNLAKHGVFGLPEIAGEKWTRCLVRYPKSITRNATRGRPL